MASLDANGWAISQVAFFQNGLLLGQKGSPPYTFIWQSGSYSLTAQVTYGSGQTVTSSSVEVTVAAQTSSPLPSPWNHQDVGTVGQPGSVAYATNGIFTVIGSGADIWDTADAFHYIYQPFSGDGTIIVRVTGVQNTDGFAKCGLMFRESLDPSSPNALEFITPSSGTGFQTRAGTNAATSYTQGTTVSPPYWLELERLGNNFNGYTSPDGSV